MAMLIKYHRQLTVKGKAQVKKNDISYVFRCCFCRKNIVWLYIIQCHNKWNIGIQALFRHPQCFSKLDWTLIVLLVNKLELLRSWCKIWRLATAIPGAHRIRNHYGVTSSKNRTTHARFIVTSTFNNFLIAAVFITERNGHYGTGVNHALVL